MIKLPLSLDDFGSRVQEVPVDGGRTHAPASVCEAGRHREDSGGQGDPRVSPGAGGREYVLYNGRALHAYALSEGRQRLRRTPPGPPFSVGSGHDQHCESDGTRDVLEGDRADATA
jgi:hypothetical protein